MGNRFEMDPQSPRQLEHRPDDGGKPANRDDQPRFSGNLLVSVNAASGTARNAWLAFLALTTYLLVTVAGVTHQNLLLNSPVRLPIINVEIPLFSFFWVAPFLLLLVHLSLLVQHALLARKLKYLSLGVLQSDIDEERVNLNHQLVNSYVFSQLSAGTQQPLVLGCLMRLMVFITLFFLPIFVLLYFQVTFLPYHDVAVTHAHRLAILLDLSLLIFLRPLITSSRAAGSIPRLGSKHPRMASTFYYLNNAMSFSLVLAVLIFSLFVATVPQGCFLPFQENSDGCFSLDRWSARWWPVELDTSKGVTRRKAREVFYLTKLFFEGDKDAITGKPTSWLTRNMVVTDTDLVRDEGDESQEVSISLRNRDLRFAMLDRSDLHRADLTGADLQFASLRQTRLQSARLASTKLQGAFLGSAKLKGAHLDGAELQGAYLAHAELQGASLTFAKLQGANLYMTKLQGSELKWTALQGASLAKAQLQGAHLYMAKLQGADLTECNLQGASLHSANLQGADFRRAKLQGSDLRRVLIWQTSPPQGGGLTYADLSDRFLAPLSVDGRKDLQRLVDESEKSNWGWFFKERFESLIVDIEASKEWGRSAERKAWTIPMPDPTELSEFLGQLACRDDTSGYIAKSIAGRGLQVGYNGDRMSMARRLSKRTCVGADSLPRNTRVKICELAEWSDDDIEKTFCVL